MKETTQELQKRKKEFKKAFEEYYNTLSPEEQTKVREVMNFAKENDINLIDFNQEISSTEIRQHIENARIDNAKKYLTNEVSHFIIKNGLYTN